MNCYDDNCICRRPGWWTVLGHRRPYDTDKWTNGMAPLRVIAVGHCTKDGPVLDAIALDKFAELNDTKRRE